jgi:hypothetical protein
MRGACAKCAQLAEIQECHQRMLSLMRAFAPPRSSRKHPGEEAEVQWSLF